MIAAELAVRLKEIKNMVRPKPSLCECDGERGPLVFFLMHQTTVSAADWNADDWHHNHSFMEEEEDGSTLARTSLLQLFPRSLGVSGFTSLALSSSPRLLVTTMQCFLLFSPPFCSRVSTAFPSLRSFMQHTYTQISCWKRDEGPFINSSIQSIHGAVQGLHDSLVQH